MLDLTASTLALLSLTCIVDFQVIAEALPGARDVTLQQQSSFNVNNCSGNIPPAPLSYDSYFPEYTRQVRLHEKGGWETWTFGLPGFTNDSLSVLTWTLGDPAAPASNPDGLATFSVLSSYSNFTAVCKDKFVYKQINNVLIDIGIGNNYLVFDGTLGTYGAWNVSVDIQGFKLDVTFIPVPPDIPFVPSYNDLPSQLAPNYFANIPMTRGHVDGFLKYPSGEVWNVHDVATIRHSWATKPVQDLLKSYTRGSSFVLLNSVNWFKAKSVSAKVIDSAQLLIGLSEDPASINFPLIYHVTNDNSLLTIIPHGLNTTLTFQGCAMSQNNPYVLTAYPVAYRGSVTDSAGGVTKYYSTLTEASLWSGNGLYVGNNSQGLLEIYTAACNRTD